MRSMSDWRKEGEVTMNSPWQSFLEYFWPSRSGPSNDKSYRLILLQSLVALGIALAAGPEVFLAMEMTAVMELLGVSLFLFAYGSAVLLLATRFARGVRLFMVPAAQAPLIHSSAPLQVKAYACLHIGVHALTWIAVATVFGAWIRIAARMAA